MNRAEERILAWALVDAAAPYLSGETRTGLNMTIGAGELESAITDLLTFFADGDAVIDGGLFLKLDAWIFGYKGTPVEGQLRDLLERIPVQLNGSHARRAVRAAHQSAT
jgi:hypothetical protein